MRSILGSTLVTICVLSSGCASGVMQSYSGKEARESHATAYPPCDADAVKSTLVREVTDRPADVDYLALFHVTGCGHESNYLCGNYLCDEGNYCNTYKCEPAE